MAQTMACSRPPDPMINTLLIVFAGGCCHPADSLSRSPYVSSVLLCGCFFAPLRLCVRSHSQKSIPSKDGRPATYFDFAGFTLTQFRHSYIPIDRIAAACWLDLLPHW